MQVVDGFLVNILASSSLLPNVSDVEANDIFFCNGNCKIETEINSTL